MEAKACGPITVAVLRSLLAEGTLRNHLKRIFEKFGVTDRTQAALMGVKRGLIRMP